jgi:hypothetical protein
VAGSNGTNGNGVVPAAAAAAAAAAGRSGPPAVPEKKVPADWREVKFATKFKAQFGTFLKVVGGPDQLGAWEIEDAPPLQWSEGDVWSITLLLPPGKHEFKVSDCVWCVVGMGDSLSQVAPFSSACAALPSGLSTIRCSGRTTLALFQNRLRSLVLSCALHKPSKTTS